MQRKHLFSLILGILFIVIGISIISIGLYCSDYLSSNFPEINNNEIQYTPDILEPVEERSFFESIASKFGLDKLVTKIDSIIQEQKKMHDGYNKSFFNIQSEIKYIMKMQIIYLIVTSVIIGVVFIVFGSICLGFHSLLVYQNKIYLSEESIRNEITIYRGGK